MKTLLFIFWASFASAADLNLSSTFSIDLKNTSATWSYLNITNSWHSEIKIEGQKVDFNVIHQKPGVFANSFSVNEMWEQSNQIKNEKIKIIENKGCKKIGRASFRCERTINEDNVLLSKETLVWNENIDIVVLRISTNKNFEILKSIADKIDFKTSGKLVAANFKRAQK